MNGMNGMNRADGVDGAHGQSEAAEAEGVRPVRLVRPRETRDLDACVRILAEVHERDGYPMNWPAEPADWLERPPFVLAARVAELEGRVVGHVALSRTESGDAAPIEWSTRTGGDAETGAGVIGRLFVAPSARGHGLGALLLTEIVREARARSLHPVLDVAASDSAAVALYERLGWNHLSTVVQQWGPTPDHRVPVRCYAAPGPGPGSA